MALAARAGAGGEAIVRDPAEDIIKAIKSNDKSLLTLELNLFREPVLTPSIIHSDQELDLLLECLQSNAKIEKLVLNNIVRDRGAAKIAKMLRENKKLQFLTLSLVDITAKGLSMLSDALVENDALLSLELKGCGMSPILSEGMLVLSTMLKSNKRLRHLGLCRFYLDEVGMSYLIKALNHESCNLSSIDLSQNGILNTINTHREFCQMLASNSKLMNVRVDFTGMRGDAMKKVVEALKRNITMRQFSIRHSLTGDDVVEEVVGFTARVATSALLNIITGGGVGMIRRTPSIEEHYIWLINLITLRNQEMSKLETPIEKEYCFRKYVERLEIPVTEPIFSLFAQEEKDKALFKAAFNGEVKMAELLLDAGANVNSRHNDPRDPTRVNKTPLFIAAEMGRPALVKLLLARGADPRLKDGPDCNGWSPYNVAVAMLDAKRTGCGECIDDLMKAESI